MPEGRRGEIPAGLFYDKEADSFLDSKSSRCYKLAYIGCQHIITTNCRASMTLDNLPVEIRNLYEVYEWRHASAILKDDFSAEWNDIIEVLRSFRLLRSDVRAPGGGKSPISLKIDGQFYRRGWVEKAFDTKMVIDGQPLDSPTHSIDCFKNQIGLEIEWNNKDPFFDRDLNNFRLLFDLRALSVGVIVTRCDELQEIFNQLGKGKSYGQSTTHLGKLLPKIQGGGGGGCPILVFGISKKLYVED